ALRVSRMYTSRGEFRMHRRILRPAMLLIPVLGYSMVPSFAGGSSGHHEPVSGPVVSSAAPGPISHVIIIYQENHSFDNVLGAECKTREPRGEGCVGGGGFGDGITADNVVATDRVPEVQHDPEAQALASENKWDQIQNCEIAPYKCVSHFERRQLPNLYRL